MKITFNNNPLEIEETTTLLHLLESNLSAAEGIAVAINKHIVPRITWNTTTIQENDNIIIVRAVCGG